MTQDAVEDSLRHYLRSEPFQEFIVELLDGQRIVIDGPHTVSMGGGGACFITPTYDLYTFSCEQIREIRPLNGEVVS
jgi:hypothetical protein